MCLCLVTGVLPVDSQISPIPAADVVAIVIVIVIVARVVAAATGDGHRAMVCSFHLFLDSHKTAVFLPETAFSHRTDSSLMKHAV